MKEIINEKISLTGTSPVQQSDCCQQSRSAATKDIVFLCV